MTKRNINVDLARIVATFFVVVLHVLGKGGVLKSIPPNSVSFYAAWFMEIGAFCAVDIFALISGYVMVDKNIKLKNIISLWLQVAFYSILFYGLFFIFVSETRTLRNIVISVLPVLGRVWWYVSSYFMLMFLIPFLNTAINNMSKTTIEKFFIIILFPIGILGTGLKIDAFGLGSGYTAIWLMIVYIFGAYIKKYDVQQKITAKKSLLGFFVMVVLTLLSKAVIHFGTKIVFGAPREENVLISYTSITILLAAVFMFLFCLNVKINKLSTKIICWLAPTTLSVYLIHVHPLVFKYIINGAFISFASKPVLVMVLYVLITAFVIFVICSVIDMLRIQLFKLIRVKNISEFVGRKITFFYKKIIKG